MRKVSVHSLSALMTVILCFLLGSCSQLQEPVLTDVQITGADIKSLTSAEVLISFTIQNPNRKSLSAESLSGSISKGKTVLATFGMNGEPLIAPPSSTSTIETLIQINITDPLALLSEGISLRDPDWSELTADADISIRIGDAGRKIRMKDYPLKDLAQRLNR